MTANAQWATIDLLQTYKAAVGAEAVGTTIMRCHLTVVPRALAAADMFWVGLHVYDLGDITGAVTVSANIANPKDNPYVDWMYARRFIADSQESNVISGRSGLDLDLRSKRKLHQVQEAFGLCIYQESVGTVAKTYDIFARTLLALP